MLSHLKGIITFPSLQMAVQIKWDNGPGTVPTTKRSTNTSFLRSTKKDTLPRRFRREGVYTRTSLHQHKTRQLVGSKEKPDPHFTNVSEDTLDEDESLHVTLEDAIRTGLHTHTRRPLKCPGIGVQTSAAFKAGRRAHAARRKSKSDWAQLRTTTLLNQESDAGSSSWGARSAALKPVSSLQRTHHERPLASLRTRAPGVAEGTSRRPQATGGKDHGLRSGLCAPAAASVRRNSRTPPRRKGNEGRL